MRSFRLSRGNITHPRLGATEPICGHSVNSLLPPRHQSVCLETEEVPGAKVTAGKLSGTLARGGRRSLSLWLLMLSGSYYCPLSVHSFPPRGSSAGGETRALLLSNRALTLSKAPACTTTGRPSENRRKLPLTETAEDRERGRAFLPRRRKLTPPPALPPQA